MFVDYTWQCMKLPDQPPTALASTARAVSEAVLPVEPETNVFGNHSDVVNDRDDVIVAAADSTTHGESNVCVYVYIHVPRKHVHNMCEYICLLYVHVRVTYCLPF